MKWKRPAILGLLLAAFLCVPIGYLLHLTEGDAARPTPATSPDASHAGGQALMASDVFAQHSVPQLVLPPVGESRTEARPAPATPPPIEKTPEQNAIFRISQGNEPSVLSSGGLAGVSVRVGTVDLKRVFDGY